MHTTIESAFAAQYAEDRIRRADAERLARAARHPRPAGTRGRRWFRRSGAVVSAARPLQSGR
jgi:hypothetical protein